MEHVFVTGVTGFVGQRLLVALARGVDDFSSHVRLRVLTRQPHPDHESVVCDLYSDNLPNDALDGVDTVFHLAGYAHDLHPENKVESRYHTVNVVATIRLAELAVFGVKKFVFVSSVKAGGPNVLGKCSSEKDQGYLRGSWQNKTRSGVTIAGYWEKVRYGGIDLKTLSCLRTRC